MLMNMYLYVPTYNLHTGPYTISTLFSKVGMVRICIWQRQSFPRTLSSLIPYQIMYTYTLHRYAHIINCYIHLIYILCTYSIIKHIYKKYMKLAIFFKNVRRFAAYKYVSIGGYGNVDLYSFKCQWNVRDTWIYNYQTHIKYLCWALFWWWYHNRQ